jgi:uncharacterized protein YcbK (DUF882 family)
MSSARAPECGQGRRALRRMLAALLAVTAAAVLQAPAQAQAGHRLVLIHTHTGEVLDAVFGTDAGYLPAELGRLDWLLRDFRTGDVLALDARLFDLLCELADAAGVEARYEVISAYRSPATNAMLVATTDGVSSKSLHMEGKAIDVRLVGVPLERLRDLALAKAVGGVGYYPHSDFVHLDVGRVRSWSG